MTSSWLAKILKCPETGLQFDLFDGHLTRRDGKIFTDRDDIISLVYPPSLFGTDKKMNGMYEKIAPFYDFSERIFGWILTGVNMQRGREEIVSLLNLKKNQRLLEVSPGPGVFQPMLRNALGDQSEIASLDLSFNMLAQCHKRFSKLSIELIQGNAQHLPFLDESFDALFHFGGINLFNEPEQALREFVRVVRKGGIVAWGDEQMSKDFRHPLGRFLLPHLNPGFLKTPPAIPHGVSDLRKYTVYGGLGYLNVAFKGG